MFETAELTRSASVGPQRSGSVESIQFLRFLAAMAVVLFHGHNASTAHLYQGLSYVFDMGAAGVHVFFVISGFVIMHTSYGSRNAGMPTGRFLLKRFVRIFPIYWMCCVAYVVYQNTFGTGYNLSLSAWLGAIFLMPGHSSRIIGPGWTLSFELFFYLSFALILRLRALPAIVFLTGLFVATIAIGFVIRFPGPLRIAHNPLILEFIAGCWLAYFFNRIRFGTFGLGLASVCAGILLFVAGAILDYREIPLFIVWGIPSVFIVGGALMIEQSGKLSSSIARLGRLGDSSYALYLIHVLIISIALDIGLRDIVPLPPAQAIGMTVVLAVICAVLAAAIFEFLERPVLRWLRRNVVDRFSGPASSPARLEPAKG
jgi:exopolysaccharide production protein ExoZ